MHTPRVTRYCYGDTVDAQVRPGIVRRTPKMSTMTGDRYRLADKAVWRVGYGAMQLAGDVLLIPGTNSRDHLAENLAVGSALRSPRRTP